MKTLQDELPPIRKIANIFQSMDGKNYTFSYDQRKWWEVLLCRPKKMKEVSYEVNFKLHE